MFNNELNIGYYAFNRREANKKWLHVTYKQNPSDTGYTSIKPTPVVGNIEAQAIFRLGKTIINIDRYWHEYLIINPDDANEALADMEKVFMDFIRGLKIVESVKR